MPNCTWEVTGRILHWGHIHERQIQLRAILKLVTTTESTRIAEIHVHDIHAAQASKAGVPQRELVIFVPKLRSWNEEMSVTAIIVKRWWHSRRSIFGYNPFRHLAFAHRHPFGTRNFSLPDLFGFRTFARSTI